MDFLAPAQTSVGRGNFGNGHAIDVVVTASPEIFPDHADYVTVRLQRGKVVLAETVRVFATELGVDRAIAQMGVKVGNELDRHEARKRKLLGG
jgi:D-ribose pyranose/furanose isomerase RbsD